MSNFLLWGSWNQPNFAELWLSLVQRFQYHAVNVINSFEGGKKPLWFKGTERKCPETEMKLLVMMDEESPVGYCWAEPESKGEEWPLVTRLRWSLSDVGRNKSQPRSAPCHGEGMMTCCCLTLQSSCVDGGWCSPRKKPQSILRFLKAKLSWSLPAKDRQLVWLHQCSSCQKLLWTVCYTH